MRFHVTAVVGEHFVGIAAVEQTVVERAEGVAFAGREVVGTKPIHDGAEFVVGPVVAPRVVAFGVEFLHVGHFESEDEDVVVANLLADLNVGTVERADGERAVEGELHVARAGSFFAGGRNLLGEIGGGDDALGERDAVVGQEGNLELTLDLRVFVDAVADDVDRADDVFREVVAGGGLGSENEHARHEVERRVLQQAAVKREDVQQVQVLALVFMQALDLHVEERVGGNFDAALGFDDGG